MCAIINANVTSEVFGDDRTPRGQILYEWLTRGKTGRLVVGGKLLRELSGSSPFNQCTLSPMTDSMSISSAKTRRRGNFRIHSFRPRATKSSIFLIILSVLAAPVAWSQENRCPLMANEPLSGKKTRTPLRTKSSSEDAHAGAAL